MLLLSACPLGCAENSLLVKGQMDRLQQQQVAMARQVQELQSRAGSLDRDNQELGSLLAQSRQKNKVAEDQLALTRDQLTSVTSQLAQARDEKKTLEQKAQTLTASMHRQGGVTISPNNSFLESLPAANIPGVQVRRDGDVIRVELPGRELFEENSYVFRAGAVKLIGDVAAEIYRVYPDQTIGVEGHLDGQSGADQPRGTHQLSVARALAVYDVLTTKTRLSARQLFVVGHGANHPVVSNATPAGRERNRRIELVIYPERGTR
jgi:flagellar motor protein MotB